MNNILNKILIYKRTSRIDKKKITEKDLQILINNTEKPRGFKKDRH